MFSGIYCAYCRQEMTNTTYCENPDCPSNKKEVRLNIGCGKKLLPEPWINCDIVSPENIRVTEQIAKNGCAFKKIDILDLKFDDCSVDEIYASHVLDHLSRNEELDKALSECYRVLKQGGILRVAVSDFEKTVKMYSEGIDLERLWGAIVGGHKTPYDKHGCAFDFTVLRRYLEKHGFVDVKRYRWQDFLPKGFEDNSAAAIPKYDLDGYLISLNVIAMKVIIPSTSINNY